MFMEYLINIAITAGAYLPLIVCIVVIGMLIKPVAKMIAELNNDPNLENKIVQHRGKVFKLAWVVAALVVLFSAMQPSNTYKHVGYDREAEDRQIKSALEAQHQRAVPEIKDRTRQPDLSREQRQERFEELVDRSRFDKKDETQ